MSLEIFCRLGCARNGLGEMASSRISTTSGALLVSASDLSCLLEMGLLLLLLLCLGASSLSQKNTSNEGMAFEVSESFSEI